MALGGSSTVTTEQRKVDSDRIALQEPVAYLHVVMNCDRPHDGASRYALDGIDRVDLGRGDTDEAVRRADATTLEVQVPDIRVSRDHARLHLRDGAWFLQDLGSKNGTFVNGRRVDASTPIASGATIEVGNTFLTLRSSSAPLLADAVGVGVGSKAYGLATMLPELADAFERLSTIARSSDGHVAILGETGVGKDVLAQAYHQLTRRSGAFIAINCAALPDGLVESQLFGHKKGAFSGATTESPGFVRAADGGTLFLDEIGDLPLLAQASLLRVLQAREVTPIGASRAVPVDVRVVSATHRDIPSMVAQEKFRHDLWARLKDFVLELPPLRARTEDMGLLISAAISRHAADRARDVRLTAGAARAMLMRRWPENVRELASAIGHALSFARNDLIDTGDLPPDQAPRTVGRPPSYPLRSRPNDDDDLGDELDVPPDLNASDLQLRGKLIGLLQANHGNVSRVAHLMGKNRTHLHDVLKRLVIDPEKYRRRVRSFD
jgi:DNA-binding NtrC family response regulator